MRTNYQHNNIADNNNRTRCTYKMAFILVNKNTVIQDRNQVRKISLSCKNGCLSIQ